MSRSFSTALRVIVVSIAALTLFACRNDIREIYSIPLMERHPEVTAMEMTIIYSDSARVRYKVIAPEYIKVVTENDEYEEFPKGIDVTSYEEDGSIMGTIRSDWAKNMVKEQLWEARSRVVAVNEEGTKVETEQLFWDVAEGRVYSVCYTRITSPDRVIEGNDGFESDQELKNPIIKNITGIIEVED